MRAPSYSAKSAFVSVARMRLAQYDPRIPDFLIEDYVPEYANSPGDWSGVTIDHTLDMATGNRRSSGNMVMNGPTRWMISGISSFFVTSWLFRKGW